ncbi:MAG TPA: ABC transporter ATP-binding protein [Terriglobales bacterium]|nr:ABC transporter ATP-binding protein [Terriglobales bacterium]
MATEREISDAPSRPLLRVRGLSKGYTRGGWWGNRVLVTAVDGAEFEIATGKTLALVGASGSGKSTVARCITRLERPDAGEICLDGVEISRFGERDLRPFRAAMQMIFQDAATAMNPRFSAAEVIEEPLLIQRRGNREQRRTRARELMQEVGLSPEWADRRAFDLSGGQRQRLAIARALALEPRLLVLDEALSGLDLSTQAQIVNLLMDLQAARSLTYLLISHDLGLVSRMADDIVVMAAGRIVEQGPASQIIASPQHPQTKTLLNSARATEAKFGAALGASV